MRFNNTQTLLFIFYKIVCMSIYLSLCMDGGSLLLCVFLCTFLADWFSFITSVDYLEQILHVELCYLLHALCHHLSYIYILINVAFMKLILVLVCIYRTAETLVWSKDICITDEKHGSMQAFTIRGKYFIIFYFIVAKQAACQH